MSQYVPTYDSTMNNNSSRYVPTERFQVLSNVYLPASDLDFRTGDLRPDRSCRCRTQGLYMEMENLEYKEKKLKSEIEREMNKGGIRVPIRTGLLIIMAVIFVCGFCVLVQQGVIAERQKAVNRQERSINDYRSQNASLEAQIADASDAATVCYIASQELHMIPASTAEAIHLVAVDTRPKERDNTQERPMQQILTVQVATETTNTTESASAAAIASNGN